MSDFDSNVRNSRYVKINELLIDFNPYCLTVLRCPLYTRVPTYLLTFSTFLSIIIIDKTIIISIIMIINQTTRFFIHVFFFFLSYFFNRKPLSDRMHHVRSNK